MFNLFLENNLITQKQSGFKLGESCINQSLSITCEIYKSFDDGFKVRSVFLYIYIKPSIIYGIKGLFSNYDKTAYRVACSTYCLTY